MPPGADRSRERSKTYTGIAKAMAEQWGDVMNYIISKRGNGKVYAMKKWMEEHETMALFERLYNKAQKQDNTRCRICGRYIYKCDDAVAIESRLKAVNLFHRDCICKESGANKTLIFTELRTRDKETIM